jgi:hypothetical protein
MSSKTTLISSLPPKALTCRASVAPSTLPLFSTRWTDGCLITCASAAFSWVRSISWRISAKVRYVTEPAFAKHSRNCAMRCLRRSAIDLVRPLAERRSRDEGSEAYFRPIGDFSGEMAVAQVDAGFTPRIIGRIDLRTHARGHRVQSTQKGIHRFDHQSSTVFPSASRLFRQQTAGSPVLPIHKGHSTSRSDLGSSRRGNADACHSVLFNIQTFKNTFAVVPA